MLCKEATCWFVADKLRDRYWLKATIIGWKPLLLWGSPVGDTSRDTSWGIWLVHFEHNCGWYHECPRRYYWTSKLANQICRRPGFNVLWLVNLNQPIKITKSCNSDWLISKFNINNWPEIYCIYIPPSIVLPVQQVRFYCDNFPPWGLQGS